VDGGRENANDADQSIYWTQCRHGRAAGGIGGPSRDTTPARISSKAIKVGTKTTMKASQSKNRMGYRAGYSREEAQTTTTGRERCSESEAFEHRLEGVERPGDRGEGWHSEVEDLN